MNETNKLTIAGTNVRRDGEGRYCLNDLHKAAGGQECHSPNRWLREHETQAGIAELQKAGIEKPVKNYFIFKRGYYVDRAIVGYYGQWVGPKFYLEVLAKLVIGGTK